MTQMTVGVGVIKLCDMIYSIILMLCLRNVIIIMCMLNLKCYALLVDFSIFN